MEVPPNETPEPVQNLFDQVIGLLSAYGWPILFFLVVANLIWSHFYPKYRKWRERLEDEQIEAEYAKDPSRIIEREESMARARQKLQEEHDRLAQEHAIKMKEKEEKKRLEKIAAMENLLHGKPKPSSGDSSSLRGGYNPLTGSGGGSCGFRPSRRGASGGG